MNTYTRRAFAKSAVAIPLAMIGRDTGAAGRQSAGASIGDTRSVFDAVFGASRQEGEFTVYDFRASGKAAYWVKFDVNGHAEYIEIDFTALPGGGLTFTGEVAGESQFVPADAVHTGEAAGAGLPIDNSRSAFYIKHYHSDALARDTGRSGNVIVVDEHKWVESYIQGDRIIERTYITVETYEVNPIAGTNERPGMLHMLHQWESAYGNVMGAQQGWYLQNPPVSGSWNINFTDPVGGVPRTIEIFPDPRLGTRGAANLISSMLPTTYYLTSTFWCPPTPNGSIGVRIHNFRIGYTYCYTLQYVHDGEQAGTVSRILFFNSENFGN